jgi:hypothetical protein
MPLSKVQLVAEASAVLTAGGYQTAEPPASWPSSARIFEDPYGIVALHVFDTLAQLLGEWSDAQGLLVDLISANVGRPDPKSWEGYLVLFTAGTATETDREAIVELRYDTNRVRKLIATSDDIETLDDVRSALLPLLPLVIEQSATTGIGLLDRLPDLLADKGIERHATEVAIDAYSRNESVVERLHRLGSDA